MGFWSSALYGNDTTCDVRDSYKKNLENQMTDSEATQSIKAKSHDLINTDEEPLFWYALADSQWRYGRLTDDVKSQAIEWLNRQGGLDLWSESSAKGAGWLKTMETLRTRLMSPMPKRKEVRPPLKYSADLWNTNDVYAYHLVGAFAKDTPFYGKYMLMQKIASVDTPREKLQSNTMQLQFFDKVYDQIPTLDELDTVRILPFDSPERVNISKDYIGPDISIIRKRDPIWMNAMVHMEHSRAYPKKRLFFIGNRQGPLNLRIAKQSCVWGHMDYNLIRFYRLWQGIAYEEVCPGYFEYDPEKR